MVSKFFLLTNLLLARVAFAAPSSHLREKRESPADSAGAVWSKSSDTFTAVTGTFSVPTLQGADGAASAWVGIDGYTCGDAILRTGVDFKIAGGAVFYDAWYQSNPTDDRLGLDLAISEGDTIKATVTASSTTTGVVLVENLTTGHGVTRDLAFDRALCEQNAEWIVGRIEENGSPAPLADFGRVTFSNAKASSLGATYTPSGATLLNIQEGGQALTSTSVTDSFLTVQYE